MVFLDSANQVFSHYYASMLHLSGEFFLKPVFLRGFSAALHIVLLLWLLALWVCKKLSLRSSDGLKSGHSRNKTLSWYQTMTLLCCLGESIPSLVLCAVNYFFWCENEWCDDKLASLSDLAVRTIAWGAVSVYLHSRFSGSAPWKLPGLLSVWLGFYLFMSCYCLVSDTILSQRHVSLGVWSLESDTVSVLSGLFLCYIGLSGKFENCDRDAHLEEPLINGSETLITPYSNATLFSLLTFSWFSPLVALGNKKVLNLEDVPLLDSRDSLVGTFPSFKTKLQSVRGDGVTTIRLVKALLLFSWKEMMKTGLCVLLYTLASYVGPYLIDTLVQYLTGTRTFKSEGYFLVSAFLFAKLVECVSQRQRNFRLQQVEVRIQGVLVGMIYDKGLSLSCQSRQVCSSGEIVNFMSIDATRISGFTWHIHDSWLLLLQVGLSLGILYKNLGLATVAAFVATFLVMLANVPLSSLLEKYEAKMMESKDARMKATSETLKNMRILKLQAWEMKFLSKIQELRKTEIGWLKSLVYTDALTSCVFWGAPMFISVVTFGTCIIMGVPLETGKVLSALATFRTLQGPIYNLPDTITTMVQTKVSLDRIASFLRLDDLETNLIERFPRGSNDTALEIINGNFSWGSTSPILKDINLKVQCGMRVAVCGAVGSGKSSLLSSILGEMARISGTLRLCGNKAYVAQSPWIQSGKIEDNILFGKEMDKERYGMVLDACCLRKDLEMLSFGDQTVVGERGINLSGGQKQRIQMARALYQDADIYLFDDPFSAVDAHTGSHLFKECLLGLLSSKTVIYVTHQVEFLPAADVILVMKDGRIAESGKYNDILQSGTNFNELVSAHKTALSELGSVHAVETKSSFPETENGKTDTKENGNVLENGTQHPQGQLVEEEEREKGGVGFQVYLKYITTAYGGALVPLILLAHIMFEALQIGSNYWMAWATPVSAEEPEKKIVAATTLITIYVALAIVSSLCVLVRSLLLATAGYKTAIQLFNKMHICIFRAPMSFFDSTPSGRILNRASTDQSEVDTDIHHIIAWTAFLSIQLLGAVVVMSQVAWQVFIVFIPVIGACVWYQRYYIPTARELSRLRGVTRAPVIQHFAETISGSTTIRSFNQEPRFREMNVKFSDGYSRPELHISAAMEWLGFRLDMLSCVMFGLSLVFLVIVPVGFIDPAIAGLAVTYGLNLNILQSSVMWVLCNMENKMISVERILQYTTIPSEPPLVMQENHPGLSWPSQGEIDIQDLQVRYGPHLPLVLRGISCTLSGGTKTGIVGRTGSGKSTLIQTLFRIVEPASGRIAIDGIHISSIGLHDLRSRLSIIPQDPTMFQGTVRTNLDPLQEYTDDQIWEALDNCQLGDDVRNTEGKLDSIVTENGDNWSMGQRQLVCLGRILLKKTNILVLDEATASVDTATDNLIQQTLRQHFADCTLVTVAHRITSILDSDRVLLLDHGLVCEYDSPKRLLEDKKSSFAQLVAEYTNRSSV